MFLLDHLVAGLGNSNRIEVAVVLKRGQSIERDLGADFNDAQYRLAWYWKYGFQEKALNDLSHKIRLNAKRVLGFALDDMKNGCYDIRLEAALSLGFPKGIKFYIENDLM